MTNRRIAESVSTQPKNHAAIFNMKLESIIAISASILFAMLAFHGAQAQTKPAKMATLDELRDCMSSESELAIRRQATEARAKQNRDEADSIRAEAEEMAVEQKRILESQGSRDKFDRRVKTHNARIQTAQANAESFRTDLEAFNKALSHHNDLCGGIAFRVEDKEAILKERGSATK